MNENKTNEISLSQCFRILWKNIYWIAACALILALAGLLYTTQFVTPTYKTEAKFYVNSISYANDKDGNRVETYNATNLDSARTMVASCIEILNAYTTLDAVIAKSGVQGLTADSLRSMISAKSSGETEILQITVTDTDPARAKLIADAITDVFPGSIEGIMSGTKLSIVDYARDARANSNGLFKNIVIGGVFGAVLCAAVLLIKEFFNPLITEDETVTNLFGLPVLAVIPDLCHEESAKPYYSHAYKAYRVSNYES